jgi:tetratricopeptide (TPR) repeat protein
MDLMHTLLMRTGQCVKTAGLVVMPMLLLACASSPSQPLSQKDSAAVEAEQQEAPKSKATEPKQYLPLTPELMYYVLSAEVAGQRGQVGIAVDLYHRAAEMVESPNLASRSAQVATLSRDQQRINRALERWVEVDPKDADVYIMQAPFLMLKNDYVGAVRAIDKALALEPDKKQQYLIRVSENLAEVAKQDEALATLKKLSLYQQNDPAARFAYARMAFFSTNVTMRR